MIDFSLIVQFFILLNPLYSLPALLSAYKQKMDVDQIALNAVLIAFIIAVSMAFVGPALFSLFNITMHSFRIAGGIALFLLAFDMIRPKNDDQKQVGAVEALISIIATPLLTGPATISFITIKTFEVGYITLLINLVLAFLLVGAVFIIFSKIIHRVNMSIIGIVSRILALFLWAVAIEMISTGLLNLRV